jgi:hypothetical protein
MLLKLYYHTFYNNLKDLILPINWLFYLLAFLIFRYIFIVSILSIYLIKVHMFKLIYYNPILIFNLDYLIMINYLNHSLNSIIIIKLFLLIISVYRYFILKLDYCNGIS